MTSPHIQALIERAKANHAARLAAQAAQASAVGAVAIQTTQATQATQATKQAVYVPSGLLAANAQTSQTGQVFNAEQSQAIDFSLQRKSFVLTGAAGTGKTTVTQEIIRRSSSMPHITVIGATTKWLRSGAPSIVVLGYTNKAVNNIRKKLPPHLQSHCMTIHKIVEYQPTYPEVIMPDGSIQKTMLFAPTYHELNKLPHIDMIIIEEASMVGIDLFGVLLAALPNPIQTQFILLGDINQLKPVFGDPILGFKMVELPTIELKHVYRQALESPIIAIATDIRCGTNHKLPRKIHDMLVIDNGEHGKVTIKPWKQRITSEQAVDQLKRFLPKLIDAGEYNTAEDMILCPYNKSFGTVEINKIIAQHLTTKRAAATHEVIARYERSYWAIGDRVMHDRQECVITKIERNPRYAGKLPQTESLTLNRWGVDPEGDRPLSNADIFAQIDALAGQSSDEESFNQASHVITVWCADLEQEQKLDTAGDINKMILGYCLTVHKSQGSEWQRVFLLLHASHSNMISRELIYTAVTRAKQELYIVCEGDHPTDRNKVNTLKKAQTTHAIPGETLEDKIRYFTSKANSLQSIN